MRARPRRCWTSSPARQPAAPAPAPLRHSPRGRPPPQRGAWHAPAAAPCHVPAVAPCHAAAAAGELVAVRQGAVCATCAWGYAAASRLQWRRGQQATFSKVLAAAAALRLPESLALQQRQPRPVAALHRVQLLAVMLLVMALIRRLAPAADPWGTTSTVIMVWPKDAGCTITC